MLARANASTGTELGTVIGADTVIEGNITAPHSMRLDGRVQGHVNVSDTLTMGPNGSVEGNVQVRSVIVGGKILGSINASDKITLNATATVNGDLTCAKLVIEEGATFEGYSKMGGTGKLPLMVEQKDGARAQSAPAIQKQGGTPGGGESDVPRWADGRR